VKNRGWVSRLQFEAADEQAVQDQAAIMISAHEPQDQVVTALAHTKSNVQVLHSGDLGGEGLVATRHGYPNGVQGVTSLEGEVHIAKDQVLVLEEEGEDEEVEEEDTRHGAQGEHRHRHGHGEDGEGEGDAYSAARGRLEHDAHSHVRSHEYGAHAHQDESETQYQWACYDGCDVRVYKSRGRLLTGRLVVRQRHDSQVCHSKQSSRITRVHALVTYSQAKL
jgi:hypothetical protein